MDVATVRENKTLAMAADAKTVGQCRHAIGEYGALTLPVVGRFADGSRAILSGECEFAALKEMGATKMMAATAKIPEDDAGGAKLSLLLSSLRKGPGALCEGMLLRDALESGASRAELCGMLGRSASWMSNRLALATRLNDGVREMLSRGLLDARSAQEIARLPEDVQCDFADKAVREGLPKSSIEVLVAGYNAEGCPELIKAQIISSPREALARVADRRRAVEKNPALSMRDMGNMTAAKPESIAACLKAIQKPMAWLGNALYFASPADVSPYKNAVMALEGDLVALLKIIHGLFPQGKVVSPGKTGGAPHADQLG